MTHTDIIKPNDLTTAERQLWMELLRDHVEVTSPFLTPQFCVVVDAVRGDTKVAVLKNSKEIIGFFPYQERRAGHAEPVGWPMSDFQALILKPECLISPSQILSLCGLTSWNFDHLLNTHSRLEKYFFDVAASPYLDLSGGYDAYKAERKKAGSNRIKQVNRKARKLEREHGELQFEIGCRDPQAFELMLQWKSEQYQRTGIFDLLSRDWIVNLLRKFYELDSEEAQGLSFVLRCNGQPIAIDMGLRTDSVLQSWFTAFDREFLSYGPGHILTVRIAEASDELGIDRIDLGKGPEEYKQSFQSDVTYVAEGTVDRRPVISQIRRGLDVTERRLKESPLADSLRKPVRLWKSWQQSIATSETAS